MTSPPSPPPPATLRLLGGFDLHLNGHRRLLTPSAQRLVGLVGIHDTPLPRTYVAFTLWLEKREERALANLRSMLWRLHDELEGIIETDSSEIALDPEITVDYVVARRAALDVLEGRSGTLPSFYIGELLPGWYEDWVVTERERLRVLHLHALERQAEACLEGEDSRAAFNAAMAATAMDPLRESAQQLLIRAALAQGNTADAIRIYDTYRSSLQHQLGLDPSPMLTELVWSGDRLAL